MLKFNELVEAIGRNIDTSKMYIRIKPKAYRVISPSHPYNKFFRVHENALLEVDSSKLRENYYIIRKNDMMVQDNFVSAVINDKREGNGRCKHCGTAVYASLGDIECTHWRTAPSKGYSHFEALAMKDQCEMEGIFWFDATNTPFLNKQ